MYAEDEEGEVDDAEVMKEPQARRRLTVTEPKCGEPKLYIYTFFLRASLDLWAKPAAGTEKPKAVRGGPTKTPSPREHATAGRARQFAIV